MCVYIRVIKITFKFFFIPSISYLFSHNLLTSIYYVNLCLSLSHTSLHLYYDNYINNNKIINCKLQIKIIIYFYIIQCNVINKLLQIEFNKNTQHQKTFFFCYSIIEFSNIQFFLFVVLQNISHIYFNEILKLRPD